MNPARKKTITAALLVGLIATTSWGCETYDHDRYRYGRYDRYDRYDRDRDWRRDRWERYSDRYDRYPDWYYDRYRDRERDYDRYSDTRYRDRFDR